MSVFGRIAASMVVAAVIGACSGEGSPAAASGVADVETPAAAGAWTVDYGASRVGFTATQTGAQFEGRFEKFEATIVLDPADLANASIDATIDIASVRTGDRQRDAALPGGDWFKAKEFPVARFQSSDIVETGDNSYMARGALTIRDITREIDLPFVLRINGDAASAESAVTLVRTDYGVGQGEFATDEWVGLDVTVTIAITATR